MSRFYDALREASRQAPMGNRDASLPELVQMPAAGVAGSGDGKNGTRQSPPEEPPEIVARTERFAPDGSDRSTGVAVHTALDHHARVIPHAADSVILEHYRRLRTKLLQEHSTRPFRLLMIASPNPLEGKTVTAMNLALSFSMLPSCRVLVIDGDLRKGSIGKWLALDGQPGLSDLIEGTATLNDVILRGDELPVHFVVRGISKASPAELLNSSSLKGHFQALTERYDLVLVDSPPLNLVTDGQLLAHCCDAVLLVARAFATTRKAFERATQDLQPFRVVGAVLNGGTQAPLYRRYNRYY